MFTMSRDIFEPITSRSADPRIRVFRRAVFRCHGVSVILHWRDLLCLDEMGGILSKLQDYFWARVDDAKCAVRRRLDNTKTAIRTRINNTKQAAVDRVVGAKNAVVNRVDSAKNAVCTKVNNTATAVVTSVRTTRDDVVGSVVSTKNRICNRITAAKNYVCDTTTAAKNAVVARVNAATDAVIRTKNAVVDRARRTRDAAVDRYVRTKEGIRSRYHSIRHAKLTRWEKVKYGSLAVVILFFFAVLMLTMLDIYLDDYDSAQQRLQTIWWCTCVAAQFLRDTSVAGAMYAWQGSIIAAENTYHGMAIAAHYGLVYGEIAGKQIYAGSLVAADHAIAGAKITADYVYSGSRIVGHYTWLGVKHGSIRSYELMLVVLEYLSLFTAETWNYTCVASSAVAYYTVEGGKLGAEYTASASAYAFKHGTVAVKHGSVWLYHYTIYFVTNFREASVEAAVWMWNTSHAVAIATSSGAYTGSILLMHGVADLSVKSYEFLCLACEWLFSASCAAADWSVVAVTNGATFVQSVAVNGFDVATVTCLAIYDFTTSTAVSLYNGSLAFAEWVSRTTVLVYEGTTSFISNVCYYLYVGVNQYGLRWLAVAGNALFDAALFLGRVLSKFFGDLAMYIANFVYVTSSRIASVIFIIASFLFSIVAAVGSVIRVLIGGLVFCTTKVFGAIIWFLRETVFAYLYMLHQYNMYREFLFFAFIGLLTVYCTGLTRDRRRLDEADDEDSESDEDVADGVTVPSGDGAASSDGAVKSSAQPVSMKDISLVTELQTMPGHDEIDDDDIDDVGIPEHIDDDPDELELEESDLIPTETDLLDSPVSDT